MLDSTTKKNIDDCRDILVGKVPDPRSQIDQITVALLYKFMHDMDQEAVALGGKARFFAQQTVQGKTIDYAQYAWPRLMATQLGGEERVKRYAEALERMPENPGLPQLFRDIFKQTFLPYRDPATLREFIKCIDKFTYDHSEKLGDAFEYLLSIMGSQGDAGQFRTPRHLIDFMAAVIDPQKHETLLDPACGTAGFLISAYKHIWRHNSSNHSATDPLAFQLHGVKQEDLGGSTKKYGGDRLSHDQRKKLVANISGYDIDPGMVKLALVNLYLHGFPEPHIYEYDTLTSTDRWDERFDVILANPPFMSPKGGIKPHGKFGIPSTRSEVLFVDYIAEHLHPGGRALIVVPEGIIFQSGKAYKALRKKLVDEHYLVGVISLPGGVFNPYSGVKTSLLWFDRALARKTDKLLFVKVEADGFDLGAQRRPIAQNDLPEAYALLMDYKRALAEGAAWKAPKGWEAKAVVVERETIAKNGEYSLSGDRYSTGVLISSTHKMVSVSAVLQKISDPVDPQSLNADVAYIGLENIGQGTGQLEGELITHSSEIKSLKNAFKPGDILYGKLRPNLNKVWLADREGICSTDIFVCRPNDGTSGAFLAKVLLSPVFNEQVVQGLGGAQLPRVNWDYFANIQIPLPPMAEQLALVAEVEGYQRVIDGARQVVAHYKPRITIDPKWEMVDLGEVSSYVGSGVTPKGGSDVYQSEGILFIRSQNVLWGECDLSDAAFVTPEMHAEMGRTHLQKNDVLLNITGASIGRCAIYALDQAANVNQHVAIIRVTERADPRFVMHTLLSDEGQRQIWSQQAGGTRQALNYPQIRGLKIPLPPLAEQQRIVAELEEERRLVEAAKTLAEKMEARVRERVARVWSPSRGASATEGHGDQKISGSEDRNMVYPEEGSTSMAADYAERLRQPKTEPLPRRGVGRPATNGTAAAEKAIQAWLQAHPGLHGKSSILAGATVAATDWNAAISKLLHAGTVRREGEKKGAKYGV